MSLQFVSLRPPPRNRESSSAQGSEVAEKRAAAFAIPDALCEPGRFGSGADFPSRLPGCPVGGTGVLYRRDAGNSHTRG